MEDVFVSFNTKHHLLFKLGQMPQKRTHSSIASLKFRPKATSLSPRKQERLRAFIKQAEEMQNIQSQRDLKQLVSGVNDQTHQKFVHLDRTNEEGKSSKYSQTSRGGTPQKWVQGQVKITPIQLRQTVEVQTEMDENKFSTICVGNLPSSKAPQFEGSIEPLNQPEVNEGPQEIPQNLLVPNFLVMRQMKRNSILAEIDSLKWYKKCMDKAIQIEMTKLENELNSLLR